MNPKEITNYITMHYGYRYPFEDGGNEQHYQQWCSAINTALGKYNLTDEQIKKAFENNFSSIYGEPIKPPYKDITIDFIDSVLKRFFYQNKPQQQAEEKQLTEEEKKRLRYESAEVVLRTYLNKEKQLIQLPIVDFQMIFKKVVEKEAIHIDYEHFDELALEKLRKTHIFPEDIRERRVQLKELETGDLEVLITEKNHIKFEMINNYLISDYRGIFLNYYAITCNYLSIENKILS